MGTGETYPDRPAGMHDIARGQCRPLSEDPRRKTHGDLPTAKTETNPFSPLVTILEDGLDDSSPSTNSLCLPMDETLLRAPYPVAGQSDPSNVASPMEVEEEAPESATTKRHYVTDGER